MTILSGKKVLEPFICKASGYIKSLLSSEHVEMNNGTTLEQAIAGIINDLEKRRKVALKGALISRSAYDVDHPNAGNVHLDSLRWNTSDGKLIHDGIGITIGKGVKTIMVSFNVFAYDKVGSYLWYKSRRERGSSIQDISVVIAGATYTYNSITASPYCIDVIEGDKIRLYKNEAKNHVIRGMGNTYMLIQIVEEM